VTFTFPYQPETLDYAEEDNGNADNEETAEGHAAQPEIMDIGYSFTHSTGDYYCCGIGGYPPVTRWGSRDSR
jgi:hypothetical protein